MMAEKHTETATFGAGCFWGVEDAFSEISGVVETAVGFMGGHVEQPRYEDVCRGDTGHAEVTQVVFDPEQISYERLLEKFFEIHDPTQYYRQGPDVGAQYRSAIFYHTPEQEQAARASMQKAQERFSSPIVTEIEPAGTFWRAEEYHQNYFKKHGGGVCHV